MKPPRYIQHARLDLKRDKLRIKYFFPENTYSNTIGYIHVIIFRMLQRGSTLLLIVPMTINLSFTYAGGKGGGKRWGFFPPASARQRGPFLPTYLHIAVHAIPQSGCQCPICPCPGNRHPHSLHRLCRHSTCRFPRPPQNVLSALSTNSHQPLSHLIPMGTAASLSCLPPMLGFPTRPLPPQPLTCLFSLRPCLISPE